MGRMATPILHLMPAAAWHAVAPDAPWRPDSLTSEGFVHCSPDDATVLAVANAAYRDATTPMVVISIDPDRLTAETRWEPPSPAPPAGSDTSLFPHVYGPVEHSAVVAVRHARRDPSGRYVAIVRRPDTAEHLDLHPHPEGGWYRETWAAPVRFQPPGYPGERASATAILFLLGPNDESVWHRVRSDELWLWHRGVLTLRLGGNGDLPGTGQVVTLGGDVTAGETVQAVVPAGTWQAATPVGPGEVLVSCIVSPGFDFADFHTA